MMEKSLPEIFLARHGETEWSLTGQHTGRTDIALTARGERNALSLHQRLQGLAFAKYSSSRLSGQYQAARAGASAMTLATD
jgi:broad specificity phosphatase PhoE